MPVGVYASMMEQVLVTTWLDEAVHTGNENADSLLVHFYRCAQSTLHIIRRNKIGRL